MLRTLSLSLVAGLYLATPAAAQLKANLIVSGLTQPVAFVQDPVHPSLQFIVQQDGHIRALQSGTLLAGDFLDLNSIVLNNGERGLLGLAFAPDYAVSRRFYVNFVNLSGNTVISRFRCSASSPVVADASSRFDLTWPDGQPWIDQPYPNHKGGNLAFGPDGYLYIGMGDGGSGDDPEHRAQNPLTLLGKMLRIDVNVADGPGRGYTIPITNPFAITPGVLPEIWDLGMRNPWRWSFDDPSHGGTGALVIADVGQNRFEEIDYEPIGQGGRNYGWRNREGLHDEVTSLPPYPIPFTDPIFEYDHTQGISIAGGYVIRGAALGSSFFGRYFFADLSSRVWSIGLNIAPGTGLASATGLTEHTTELGPGVSTPVSFGTDIDGELYIVNYNGTIYRIATTTPVSPAGCTTSDPFVALGGGTCANGGWLPPGLAPGSSASGSSGSSGSAPGGTSSGTSGPSRAGGCTTPDPFVAIGGGTCVNGGWLPPGLAPSSSASGSSGSTSGGTSSGTPGGLPGSGGCTTPDPFVALGGGACVNGGWLPPGLAPSSSASGSSGSTSGGTSAGTPGGSPGSGGCTTPDPFVALGGGTCVNGGWLPPGLAPGSSSSGLPSAPGPSGSSGGTCATPDPFASFSTLIGVCSSGGWTPVPGFRGAGVVHFYALEGGFWGILASDGRVYQPIGGTGIPASLQVEGKAVTVAAKFLPSGVCACGGIAVDLVTIAGG